MKVWIVLHGENGEGGKVVSVHSKLADAMDARETIRYCWQGGWKLAEVNDTRLEYRNGCDFVALEEWEVRDV